MPISVISYAPPHKIIINGRDYGVAHSLNHQEEVERMSFEQVTNLWRAAEVTHVEELATRSYLSAVFWRMVRANLISIDGELTILTSDANSREQGTPTAYTVSAKVRDYSA